MYSLLFTSVCALALSLLLTPLCRVLCIRYGFVDAPDHNRKVHTSPIPRAGGIPIVIAYVAAFGLLFLTRTNGSGLVHAHLGAALAIAPAVAVVFVTGLLDDFFSLSPWQKFAGQLLAAGLAWQAGVRIHFASGIAIGGPLSFVVTVFWLVGCANALNLIDGLDGLASGIALFATLTSFAAGVLQGNYLLLVVTAPLAGALLGFLRYNFNPASIFLGDSGSLSVGFLLGCFAVVWSQKSATLLGMTAPLMALAIPLADTALSIARRFLRGRPLFSADLGHIHHLLLKRGLTVRGVTLLLYGVCFLGAVLSIFLTAARTNQASGVVVLLFVGAVAVGVHHLGYAEFSEARRVVFGGILRRIINARLSLNKLEQELAAAGSPDARWNAILALCRDYHFAGVRFRIDGRLFESKLNGASPDQCWRVRVPLGSESFAEFFLPFDGPIPPAGIAPMVETIRRHVMESPASEPVVPS